MSPSLSRRRFCGTRRQKRDGAPGFPEIQSTCRPSAWRDPNAVDPDAMQPSFTARCFAFAAFVGYFRTSLPGRCRLVTAIPLRAAI